MENYSDNESVIFKTFYSHLLQIYLSVKLNAKDVLEIGKGYGFVSSVLCQYCNLTTLDFEKEFNPDILMDITKLKQLDTLEDEAYDLILLCEVLEHIPYDKVEGILQILRNKTRKYIVISVPNQSGYCNITLFSSYLNHSAFKLIKFFLDLFSVKIGSFVSRLDYKFRKKHRKFIFERNHGHYWELGVDKYDICLFKKLLEKYFVIINEERIKEHPFHHFFILKKV